MHGQCPVGGGGGGGSGFNWYPLPNSHIYDGSQNLWAGNSFWGMLQTKNIIGAVVYTLIMFVFPLFIKKNIWHSLYKKLCRRLWITFVDNMY